MRHGKPDDTRPASGFPEVDAEETQVSRRSLLLGLIATGAFALPLLSTSTQAAVSMLRSGIDPDAVEPEVIPAGKKGGGGRGKGGGGGRGRGGGKGRGHGGGHGRGHKGRGHGGGRGRGHHHHHHYGRGRYGHRRYYYGGYYGGCYNPWYRRRYWYRCVGWF